MFGRFGWICRICNNFNFETRSICNRCKTIKVPKTKEEINKIRKKKKNMIKENKKIWLCPNCENINYNFRKYCNRCEIERKNDFPSVYLVHYQKLNKDINNIASMKKTKQIKNYFTKNINKHVNKNN